MDDDFGRGLANQGLDGVAVSDVEVAPRYLVVARLGGNGAKQAVPAAQIAGGDFVARPGQRLDRPRPEKP